MEHGPASTRRWIALAVLTIAVGCTEDDSSKGFAPANCQREPPTTAALRVKVTVNTEHERVPIAVFEGDFELDNVVVTDTLSVEQAEYQLPVDRDYGVAAEYKDGDQIVLAIDGGRLSLGYDDYDDARCWKAGPLDLDATLASAASRDGPQGAQNASRILR